MEQNILDRLNELIKDKGETLLLTLLENIQPKDFLTEKEMCKYLMLVNPLYIVGKKENP